MAHPVDAETGASALIPVNMLWVGRDLGPIERVSLASFVAAGHPVHLYTYGPVGAIPAGVERLDGEEILDRATIEANRYPSGSYSLAANLFRLVIQERELGLWCDTDVVCLKPIRLTTPIVVGRESDRYVNNAVLRLEPGSPVLRDMMAAFQRRHIPEWMRWDKGLHLRIKNLMGRDFGPRDLPRGLYGPKAITALIDRYALHHLVQPAEVFYPLHPRRALEVFDSSLNLSDITTEQSLTIHLWNEKLPSLADNPPKPNSILADLIKRYDG